MPDPAIDFKVVDHGTVLVFDPLTDRAKVFSRERVDIPDHMRVGRWAFAADHRPGHDLLRGLVGEEYNIAYVSRDRDANRSTQGA